MTYEIIKGDDVDFSLRIDEDGVNINVSGFSFTLQIRHAITSNVIIFEITGSAVDMTKSQDGIVVFTIPKATTAGVKVKNAVLGVFYIDDENRKKTVVPNEPVKFIEPVAR